MGSHDSQCSRARHVLPYTARPTGVLQIFSRTWNKLSNGMWVGWSHYTCTSFAKNQLVWRPLPSVSPWVTWVTKAPVCSSYETMEGHWAHAEQNLHNSRLDDSNSFLAVNHIRSNLRGQDHLYTTLVCCNWWYSITIATKGTGSEWRIQQNINSNWAEPWSPTNPAMIAN